MGHPWLGVGVALWVEIHALTARRAMGKVGGTIVRPHLLYMLRDSWAERTWKGGHGQERWLRTVRRTDTHAR